MRINSDGMKDCPECDGKGHDETISDCCGAKREPDMGLCYECHDHCEPSECPECNGTGEVPYTDEDAARDKEDANISNREMMRDE